MNDHAAPTREFGTGLRARLERGNHARERDPLPSSRDLLDLVDDDPVERSTPELVLVSGDLSRHRAPGPVVA
jgi:hypothetical protein